LNDVIGFELRPKREVKEQTDFLIVDEAGMVGKALYDDLLSFGIPILFVGDKEQLPPVDSTAKGFNVMDAASVHLTEIHRQAEGNPIIALSRHIRENGTFDRKLAGNEIIYMRKTGITKNFLQNNTINVTLCGTNKTRLSLNRLARAAYGFDDDRAQQGEIVIGLKNMGLVNNGERFMVVSVAATKYKHAEYTLSSDSTTSIFTVKVPDECWFEEPVHINRGKNPDWAVMTYGYAITVYKSQGSEFDNVLYVDEDVSYFVDQRKFRYTAVTRAKQRVFIAT
jgi:exodeoxyribonuclease-5